MSEWLTAALLVWGFRDPRAGVIGAILSAGTFVTTVTIIWLMPGGWDAAAGFPAMTGNVPFLMEDVARVIGSPDTGATHAGDRRAVEVSS